MNKPTTQTATGAPVVEKPAVPASKSEAVAKTQAPKPAAPKPTVAKKPAAKTSAAATPVGEVSAAKSPASKTTKSKTTAAKPATKTTRRKAVTKAKAAPKTAARPAARKTGAAKPVAVEKSARQSHSVNATAEIFSLHQPKFPTAFREVAENGVKSAKDAYAKAKNAAEEATDLLEGSVESTRQGVVDANLKMLELARENTDAVYAFTKKLFAARSFGEVLELQAAFGRERLETAVTQTRELQKFAHSFAEDTTKPYQDAVAKTLKNVDAA